MRYRTGLGLLGMLAICGCSREIELANNDATGLVDAIRRANSTPGGDTIRLARNGLYILQAEAEPGLLLPAIRGKLRIEGNGAEVRGYTSNRVALVEVAAGSDVLLRQLSLAEGSDGAIRNFGKLKLQSTRVVDSIGTGVSAIVLNHGQLVAEESEFAYNALGSSLRDSGTVLNYGDLRLAGSRIHDNRVEPSRPGTLAAGAVLNMGTLHVKEVRLDNNSTGDLTDAGRNGAAGVPGVLNLGNGTVQGKLPAGVATDGMELIAANRTL